MEKRSPLKSSVANSGVLFSALNSVLTPVMVVTRAARMVRISPLRSRGSGTNTLRPPISAKASRFAVSEKI